MDKRKTQTRKQKSVGLTDIEWTYLDLLASQMNTPQNSVISQLLVNHAFLSQFLEEYLPARLLFQSYLNQVVQNRKHFESYIEANNHRLNDYTLDDFIEEAYGDIPMYGEIYHWIKAHNANYIEQTLTPEARALSAKVDALFSDTSITEEERLKRLSELNIASTENSKTLLPNGKRAADGKDPSYKYPKEDSNDE